MTMHFAFIGCCLLMVNFSASLRISQSPRFIGVNRQIVVPMHCRVYGDSNVNRVAEWFKKNESIQANNESDPVKENNRVKMSKRGNLVNGQMNISNLEPTDTAVYYCKVNGSWGPGTVLQVHKKINPEKALMRSRIKDVMIFIQALLLAVVIASLALHLKQGKKDEDVIYEEPEDNHIYEGLGIEHCGLYEDPVLCQNSEATWDKADSSYEE
ncbi:B-cell antigen receptor complex-associated protein beta chain [Conger conger]|uniref:B-cell antigen receptor complex-associated protein beta chain n=1 Tax=Conger conger TaxID=82655 RepID=UPI002A59DA7A|nr:B-cell antigen receptor complex-associated protein beta chain [Conger conger]